MSDRVQFEEDSFARGSGPAGSGRSDTSNLPRMERWLINNGIVSTERGAQAVLIGLVIINLIIVYLVVR